MIYIEIFFILNSKCLVASAPTASEGIQSILNSNLSSILLNPDFVDMTKKMMKNPAFMNLTKEMASDPTFVNLTKEMASDPAMREKASQMRNQLSEKERMEMVEM